MPLTVYRVSRLHNRRVNSRGGDATLQFRAEQLNVGRIHSCKLQFGKNSHLYLQGVQSESGDCWTFSVASYKETVYTHEAPKEEAMDDTVIQNDGLFEGPKMNWEQDGTRQLDSLMAGDKFDALDTFDWALLARIQSPVNCDDILSFPDTGIPSNIVLDAVGHGCFIAAYHMQVSNAHELQGARGFIAELQEREAKLVCLFIYFIFFLRFLFCFFFLFFSSFLFFFLLSNF